MNDQNRIARLHNRLAGEIVKKIVKPTIDAGGSHTDVLVLTESVVAGVILVCVRLGGDEIVLDKLMERVKARLAQLRLGNMPTAGEG